MLELNLFMVEPDFVPIDKEYHFYDITDDFCKGKINPEVIIEGKTRKVLKVMVCRQSWINKYYEEPLKECVNSKGERIKFYDFDEDPNTCFCGEKSCDCCCYCKCDCYCIRKYLKKILIIIGYCLIILLILFIIVGREASLF